VKNDLERVVAGGGGGGGLLQLTPQHTAQELGVAEVMTHLLVVLESVGGAKDSLHRPFIQLINEPNSMLVCGGLSVDMLATTSFS